MGETAGCMGAHVVGGTCLVHACRSRGALLHAPGPLRQRACHKTIFLHFSNRMRPVVAPVGPGACERPYYMPCCRFGHKQWMCSATDNPRVKLMFQAVKIRKIWRDKMGQRAKAGTGS